MHSDTRFLLGGGLIVFGIGVLVAMLVQMGSGDWQPIPLLLSGLASLIVFLLIRGLVSLVLPQLSSLSSLQRAVTLALVFLFAGALAWLVVQTSLVLLDLTGIPSGRQVLVNIVICGLLAVLFGSGFHLYETMRQRLLDNASRLKEAEFAEKELNLARSIQERLLPPSELANDGYRVAAHHLPARYVAGDFFDVFSLPDGTLGLVVADVAGKGVGASLIMASVKSVLPLLAAGRTVDETLVALNDKLCDELDRRQFVALAFARYVPANGELFLANAGLPDPYILRPGAQPDPVIVEGPRMPLGMMRSQEYRTARSKLRVGEGLLMFSDGLPEASTAAGEPLGYEALAALLPTLASAPATWLNDLFTRVQQSTGPDLEDDWTALLLERIAST